PARPAPQPARPAAEPQPARPAAERPESARPAPPAARPAPEPARVRAAAPAPPPAAPAPAAAGASAADSLRQSWDAILDAVKQERRVAWILLSHASVLSLEDGILTLRFPREGDMKAFSVSGHDAVLKRVLSTDLGLNVTIKGVAGGDAQTGRPGTGAPAAARPPAVRRDPVPAPSESAPPEFAGPEFTEPYDEPDDMPPGEVAPDEPSPDDRAVRNAELTGMDLIQRELGGQVIGEFEG
ncbi:MAG TPA: hypothetical protein VNO54_21150, partial [Streptosporangiaceae bacterium]|nr:hypothetical protein [Streptosporangiaceae bacterium]